MTVAYHRAEASSDAPPDTLGSTGDVMESDPLGLRAVRNFCGRAVQLRHRTAGVRQRQLSRSTETVTDRAGPKRPDWDRCGERRVCSLENPSHLGWTCDDHVLGESWSASYSFKILRAGAPTWRGTGCVGRGRSERWVRSAFRAAHFARRTCSRRSEGRRGAVRWNAVQGRVALDADAVV
jgi:hypothetical protein